MMTNTYTGSIIEHVSHSLFSVMIHVQYYNHICLLGSSAPPQEWFAGLQPASAPHQQAQPHPQEQPRDQQEQPHGHTNRIV